MKFLDSKNDGIVRTLVCFIIRHLYSTYYVLTVASCHPTIIFCYSTLATRIYASASLFALHAPHHTSEHLQLYAHQGPVIQLLISVSFIWMRYTFVCVALYQHIANFKLQIKCSKCFNSTNLILPYFHEPLVACTISCCQQTGSKCELDDFRQMLQQWSIYSHFKLHE